MQESRISGVCLAALRGELPEQMLRNMMSIEVRGMNPPPLVPVLKLLLIQVSPPTPLAEPSQQITHAFSVIVQHILCNCVT